MNERNLQIYFHEKEQRARCDDLYYTGSILLYRPGTNRNGPLHVEVCATSSKRGGWCYTGTVDSLFRYVSLGTQSEKILKHLDDAVHPIPPQGDAADGGVTVYFRVEDEGISLALYRHDGGSGNKVCVTLCRNKPFELIPTLTLPEVLDYVHLGQEAEKLLYTAGPPPQLPPKITDLRTENGNEQHALPAKKGKRKLGVSKRQKALPAKKG